jgi:predicted transcriptional regulator
MLGKVISWVVGWREFCYALSVPNDSDLPRLGPLEMHLLRAIWKRRNSTVRELIESGEFNYAYTTLMTTLDRLYKKGLLERTAEGRAFRYTAALSRAEFDGHNVRNAIRKFLGGASPSPAPLSFLVDAVSEHDTKLLDSLEKAIEAKRRELNGDSLNGEQK